MAGSREEEQIPMTGDTLQQAFASAGRASGSASPARIKTGTLEGMPAMASIGEISSRCGKNTGPTSRSPA